MSDCTACGACCFSSDAAYIPVFAVDEARMDARARALTEVVDGRRSMRFVGPPPNARCAALRIESGRFLCSIYQARPDACRWLVPGSGACREQILKKSEIARTCAAAASGRRP